MAFTERTSVTVVYASEIDVPSDAGDWIVSGQSMTGLTKEETHICERITDWQNEDDDDDVFETGFDDWKEFEDALPCQYNHDPVDILIYEKATKRIDVSYMDLIQTIQRITGHWPMDPTIETITINVRFEMVKDDEADKNKK